MKVSKDQGFAPRSRPGPDLPSYSSNPAPEELTKPGWRFCSAHRATQLAAHSGATRTGTTPTAPPARAALCKV